MKCWYTKKNRINFYYFLVIFLLITVINETTSQNVNDCTLEILKDDISFQFNATNSIYEAQKSKLSRVNNEKKGWCAYNYNGDQYVEVRLDKIYRVTEIDVELIESDGKFSYEIEYQHPNSHNVNLMVWRKWKNQRSISKFSYGRQQINPELQGIVSIRIRPSKMSKVCLQFNIYGCEWTEKLYSYEIPKPDSSLYDAIYDGISSKTKLTNGLGQLTDKVIGGWPLDARFQKSKNSQITYAHDYVGWRGDFNNKVDILFRFYDAMQFSSIRIFYAKFKNYDLFNNVEVSVYTSGKKWKNNDSDFNEIFQTKDLNDFGYYSIELKRPSRGKFLKLSFNLTDQMMLLLSEIEFKFYDSQDTDEPKSIPKTYPKYTKETDHIFVTTDYETSLNKTNNKSNTEVDKEESKKGSSALITVLVIILFAVIFMILVAIIIKRKKRKHIENVQQNEYSRVDSRFEDITKLVTSDDAERNITNVSYDEENSIYHEVSNQQNVYLLPTNTVDDDEISQHSTSNTEPGVKETLPPKESYLNPKSQTMKSLKQTDETEKSELESSEKLSFKKESVIRKYDKLSNSLNNLIGNELTPYAQVNIEGDFNGFLDNENMASQYAVPWDQDKDPKLLQLLASSSCEDLLKDTSSGVQWPDDRLRRMEFPRSKLTFVDDLGKGQFGSVQLCKAHKSIRKLGDLSNIEDCDGDGNLFVAFKTELEHATKDEKNNFLKEVRIMSRLSHPNIVRLLAVVTTSEPFAIITEYMDKGDLSVYLQHFEIEAPNTRDATQGNFISNTRLLDIIMQITRACEYLASVNFVHRDLAARNILIDRNEQIRLGDFGMSRNMYSSDYYRIKGYETLPIRWMAWESVMTVS